MNPSHSKNFYMSQKQGNAVIKKIILVLISSLLLYSVGFCDEKIDGENQAVILMYHHFGVEKYPTTNIRLQQFDAHLDYLSKVGYKIWPLTKVAEYIKDRKVFPGRVLAITIDDAYLSVYQEAYPRLLKRGWPFTVFVATDGIDHKYHSYMTWDQMREMQKHGVTFANHSSSHDYLIRYKPNETTAQWKSRVRHDIEHAQSRLKTELGKAPMLFAYPFGEYNTELARIVTNMGYVAFGQQSGPAGVQGDIRDLPRFPMSEKYGEFNQFKQKVASLAFSINDVEPWDPSLLTDHSTANEPAPANPPVMRMTLGKSDALLDQLTCYVSGQGRVKVKWLNEKERRFLVQAKSPLPGGRSRYNCTAPSTQKGRYYWYSHLWILPVKHAADE
jgi:poly-beta-1,6-N-acetyl-D-glucosamine N-deacetylase